MKIIIMGAGTLGRSLAAAFCGDLHDVVVIDTSPKVLKRLRDKSEVMTIVGDGTRISTLVEAGIVTADLFVGVTNSDVHNMHGCRIAKHFGAKNTICRLQTMDYFDASSGLTPVREGIDHVVQPVKDCVRKICDVLDFQYTRERIIFSTPEAYILAFELSGSNPLNGLKLRDFPEHEMIKEIRFPAIFRDGGLIAPRGDTVMQAGDEVYISGRRDSIEAMMRWVFPDARRIRSVVIAGGGMIGTELAKTLCSQDYDVKLIEFDAARTEQILEEIESGIMVINGDANDRDILEEAGVADCDAFVAVQDDDEDNILSCALAKQMGAGKVITLTNKEEYITLLPTMEMIDCGFSKWLVAVNSVLRHMSSITHSHTNAIFHRMDAYVSEYEVRPRSQVCNRKIDECKFPAHSVLAMVFRGQEVLSPSGGLTLLEGDFVTAVVNPKSARALEATFEPKDN